MLSEEEKESIEQLKSWRKYIIKNKEKVNKANNLEFYLRTVLNLITKLQKEIEHQKEKRENQKAELTILNEKQKEMNKLTNTVSSYKGMFKRQQKDQEKKDKQIDLMARAIDNYDSQLEINTFKDKEHIKQYFKEIAEENSSIN